MIKYLLTSTAILFWFVLLSVVWTWLCYEFRALVMSRRTARAGSGIGILPSIAIGSLIVIGVWKLFGFSMIFPVFFSAHPARVFLMSAVPALVLALSSGLVLQAWRNVDSDYGAFTSKPFATFAVATGQNLRSVLRRLVIAKSVCQALGQSLPWFFSELVMVEALFNAPGLGLDAWHQARVRDVPALMEAVTWIIVIFGCSMALNGTYSRHLGRRLQGYA